MLGNAYRIHDSCVIAHDNVVQQVRKRETENNGLIFAAAAQIIPLETVCTGSVVVKVDLQKESEVNVNGTMHFQFSTILSCKVLVMAQRTKEKKRAKRTVHVDIDRISDESASEDEEGQDLNLDED